MKIIRAFLYRSLCLVIWPMICLIALSYNAVAEQNMNDNLIQAAYCEGVIEKELYNIGTADPQPADPEWINKTCPQNFHKTIAQCEQFEAERIENFVQNRNKLRKKLLRYTEYVNASAILPITTQGMADLNNMFNDPSFAKKALSNQIIAEVFART